MTHTNDTAIFLPMNNGQSVVIDADDLALVSGYKWRVYEFGRGLWYAQSYRSGKTLYMHRMLMAAEPGQKVDHRDGDGLNNRRANLRIASHGQNMANTRLIRSNNKTGFKGITYRAETGRWIGQIAGTYLGTFGSAEDAARAYDAAAIEMFGEFAQINFPPQVKR